MKKNIYYYITCITISITFTSVVTFSNLVIPTHQAEAVLALESTQWLNRLTLGTIAGSSAANAGANIENILRENVLDGLAWSIAKQMVSSMIRSLINWVNSGFQGSPAFLQDLKQHLLGVLDQTAGQFIQSLGEIGEFICSPFRLDVQAALSINYAKTRSNVPSGPTEGMCTLSGVGSNIENFLSGTVESMDQWLKVTSNPQNTPYGAYLEAEAKMNVALRNAAGQEVQLLNFNDGFLSRRICEGINGQRSQEGQNCRITTPGRVIADQLNKALGAGQDALIQADEINELIGSLLNQLVMKALQGVNGILGLGGNDSYTDSSLTGGNGSYLDALVLEDTLNGISMGTICKLINNQGTIENNFLQIIDHVLSTSTEPFIFTTDENINIILDEASKFKISVNSNLQLLNEFVNRLSTPNDYTTATKTASVVQKEAITQFSQILTIGGLFNSQFDVDNRRNDWSITFPSLTNLTLSSELPWGSCKVEIIGNDNSNPHDGGL